MSRTRTPGVPPRVPARRLAAAVALALASAACSGGGSRGAAEGPRPDLLLITVDTLRADRVGAYGYEPARTPVIDGLAARGTVFLQATTPFPRTTPALASLMTGLWPQHHGSREVAQPMRPVESLATLLRRRGYHTVGVTANGVVGTEQRFDRGFAEFFVARDAAGRLGGTVTDRSLAFAAEAVGRPLFLWAHYLDPHFPYLPPDSWSGQPGAARCREVAEDAVSGPLAMGALQADAGGRAAAALADCSRLYDEEIAYTDAQIGRLLAGLAELGRGPDDGFVVLAADHGENLGEEDLFYEHGPSLHDASLRVPLILVGPGVGARRDDGIARLEDVAPTLLRLLGVPREEWPRMDGVDLTPRLAGEVAAAPRVAVAEGGSALHHQLHAFLRSGRADGVHCVNVERWALCERSDGRPGLYDPVADPELAVDLSDRLPRERRRLEAIAARWPVEGARHRAVRIPGYKLVERPAPDGTYRRELYDLRSDAGELVDASARLPEVRAELDRLLDAWTRGLPEAGAAERTAEELEALRSLGYVQ